MDCTDEVVVIVVVDVVVFVVKLVYFAVAAEGAVTCMVVVLSGLSNVWE